MRFISAALKSPVIRVLFGDALAKFFLLVANIFLIQKLDINEYSTFAVLSSAIFLGYQLACAPIERLYIAEHHQYRGAIVPLLLLFSLAGGLATYTWMVDAPSALWLVLVLGGVVILSLYQFVRIQFQQREQFFGFLWRKSLKTRSGF